MKRVLLITDVNFWEQCSGNRTRILTLVEYLSQHVQLTVVNTGPAPMDIESTLAAKFPADFFILEKTKYLNSNGYGRRLKALLKNEPFDAIIIEYIHSSYFLNFLENTEAKIILDAHDIISERTEAFKKYNYAGALYELSNEAEQEILDVYDHVMVLCKPDHDAIGKMIGPGRALLCPHPVLPSPHGLRPEVKNIAFIASAYLPNADAITWFLANCWPPLREKYDVQLCLYGTVCSNIKLADRRQIVCKGFIPGLDHIYEETDIVINPVRFGAGLKIKNVEALANGLPLVTTSHGTRGIAAAQSNACLVADSAEDFTRAVSFLIEDAALRQELRKNALCYVKQNLSADKCFSPLLAVINA
ncbi:MAG: glycosyltransferase family 4 protein [Bacteroidota bacterium]|nr:glycosyltransferase family 4 protein [Bacteroidota bacterium]